MKRVFKLIKRKIQVILDCYYEEKSERMYVDQYIKRLQQNGGRYVK